MLEEKTPVSRLILIIVLTVVLFALSIYIGFYMGMNSVSEELVVAEIQTTPIVSTSATSTPTNSPIDTSDWKTYTNNEYGYSLKYPSDWELKEYSNMEGSPITLISPETKKIIEQNTTSGGASISSEFQIDYYPSITDEAENKANNYSALTIDELINKNSTLTKIGTTKLGNNPAIDLIWGGYGTNYTILSDKNNHLYKVRTNVANKNGLSEIQNEIINSFQFTK
jgi:hypothetical protein